MKHRPVHHDADMRDGQPAAPKAGAARGRRRGLEFELHSVEVPRQNPAAEADKLRRFLASLIAREIHSSGLAVGQGGG